MPFTKAATQPNSRTETDPNIIAPGLYSGETVYTIDLGAGEDVAVRLSTERAANNDGVIVTGRVRWIYPDGMTNVSVRGGEGELEYHHPFDAGWVEKHGVDNLAREVLMLMLGEPPTMVPSVIVGIADTPLVPISDDACRQINIRKTIEVIRQAEGAADAGALLG